jgi:hypothetical protein
LRIPAFALAKSEMVCSLHVNNARDYIGPGFYFPSDFFFQKLQNHILSFSDKRINQIFFSTNFAYNNSLKMTN